MANITNEIISMRDRDTKHFATDEPNTFVAQINKNQHYYNPDLGIWDDVANLIGDNSGVYSTKTNNFAFGYDTNTGSYHVTCLSHGYQVGFTPSALYLYDYTSPNPPVKLKSLGAPAGGTVTITDNVVTRTGMFGGLATSTVSLYENQMVKQVVINSRPTLPDLSALGMNPATTSLVIAISVSSPFPLSVSSTGQLLSGMSVADLVIDDGQGQRLFIPSASCWGSNKSYKPHDIAYINDPVMGFGICVPYSFVQIAKYPIYIDPTVAINDITGNNNSTADNCSMRGGNSPTMPVSVSNAISNAVSMDFGAPCISAGTWCDYENDGKGDISFTYWLYRGFVRFNLASIPTTATLVSATLALTSGLASGTNYQGNSVTTITIDPTLIIAEVIPNWSTTAGPVNSFFNIAAVAAHSSASLSGLTDNFVFTSGVKPYFGQYCAFRLRWIPATEGSAVSSTIGANGPETLFFTWNDAATLSVVYTTGISTPTATSNQLLLTGAGT